MNTDDKQSIRKVKSDQEEYKRVQLYKEVFGTKAGQAALADMAKAAGLNERVFTLANKGDHVAYDPLRAALKDGARDVIIRIHNILQTPLKDIEKPKPKVIK